MDLFLFRKKQAQLDHLSKSYKNSKLTTGVSIKSLKNKSKLLNEMLKEGRVSKQVKSPKVVNNLTKILSTDEINKKFQKLCDEGKQPYPIQPLFINFRIKPHICIKSFSLLYRSSLIAFTTHSLIYVFTL